MIVFKSPLISLINSLHYPSIGNCIRWWLYNHLITYFLNLLLLPNGFPRHYYRLAFFQSSPPFPLMIIIHLVDYIFLHSFQPLLLLLLPCLWNFHPSRSGVCVEWTWAGEWLFTLSFVVAPSSVTAAALSVESLSFAYKPHWRYSCTYSTSSVLSEYYSPTASNQRVGR